MNISDLKLGQKLTIDGVVAEYKGIQKIHIPKLGKVQKRVFLGEDLNMKKYLNIADGNKTLESQKIVLL